MYKKITHTIVEEHFNHPMTMEMAKNCNTPVGIWPALPAKYELVNAIRAQFSKLNSNLRELIISKLANSDDIGVVTNNLSTTASEFTSIIGTYLDNKVAQSAVNTINSFIKTIDEMISSIKNGNSIDDIRSRAITSFKEFLNLITGNLPLLDLITLPYVESYVDYLIQEITARLKKDFNSESKAVENARTIMALGPVYEPPFYGRQDIATNISNIITNAYPTKFR
jgi:hypothetical protein